MTVQSGGIQLDVGGITNHNNVSGWLSIPNCGQNILIIPRSSNFWLAYKHTHCLNFESSWTCNFAAKFTPCPFPSAIPLAQHCSVMHWIPPAIGLTDRSPTMKITKLLSTKLMSVYLGVTLLWLYDIIATNLVTCFILLQGIPRYFWFAYPAKVKLSGC